MNASFVIVVVLVAGLAVLASTLARKRGFSHNQRIVLSGVAIAMLIWALMPGNASAVVDQPGRILVVGLGVVVLITAVRYLGRKD